MSESDFDKCRLYELEKKRLQQDTSLTPTQYEDEIKKLAIRLGV